MKYLIAEFEEQSFTQIIFPHPNTDWNCCLDEAQNSFINIINTIIKYQKCLVVCANLEDTKNRFEKNDNLYFVKYETNDCWARDISALCVKDAKRIKLLDFEFNAWGGKFDAKKDNAMNRSIIKSKKNVELDASVIPYLIGNLHTIDFILEGGAIESNGVDTILTTSKCMLNKNRNPNLDPIEITQKLNKYFGITKILYLNYGYLAGDDTDSHIDTLARFISKDTIMYVVCEDENDEHYLELQMMKKELEVMANEHNFKLIVLPLPSAIYEKNQRLPATYANFVFVNGAVLVPIYGVKQDKEVLNIFRNTFKDRDVIPINCLTLIKQHGSLHCVCMNFASGVAINI
ncbi:MAG: agmatine deiminase family protein [Sulfurimonas sp.]|nr:agmatine deiminase family protein [Sulfurimonas sp.]